MNKTKYQSGSAHIVVIIILVLALIGSLGFVFYQNFIQNKDDTSEISEINADEESETAQVTPVAAPDAVVNELVTSYLDYINSTHTTSYSSNLLTDEFQTVIDNPSGEIIIVDPILLVQNTPNGFTVGSVTVSGESASVPVALNFAGEPYNITYSLIIVNNEWKIDGVVKG